MSAIYGVIDLNGNKISETIAERIHAGYEECKIDKHYRIVREEAVIGCEIQYFRKENKQEVLPIVDDENKFVFTADCFLDNRKEILELLQINDKELPDGRIIYLSYLKWGKDCVKYIRGFFSFVVYYWEKKEVYLFADHFSNRCLYYHIRDGILYFSTLFFPMIEGSGLKFKKNDRWLVDCISNITPGMMLEDRETAYLDVMKVDKGNYVYITLEGAKYYSYWNPVKNVIVNDNITDEECEERVRKIMFDSVKKCIDVEGNVSILLSGGLDSTTVGGVAAQLLQESNKKLYSFTSIPLKESGYTKDGNMVYDETEGVKIMCSTYSNIIPTYIDCEGKNAIDQAEHILHLWELPSKSQQNSVWIDEATALAVDKGCKVMLDGGIGNFTLSAGKIHDYLMDEILHFKFIKAFKDFNHYAHKHNMRRKNFILGMLKAHNNYRKNKNKINIDSAYEDNFTRRDIGQKYGWAKKHHDLEYGRDAYYSFSQIREDMYYSHIYIQAGEIDTKESLMYGILKRDPIKTVEMHEFCCSLPLRCFVNENYERRLVRECMHDVVPEKIRFDVAYKGRQSVDNVYRIKQIWNEKKEMIKKTILSEETLNYLDKNKVIKVIDNISQENMESYGKEIYMIENAYMFSLYLKWLDTYV